MSTWKAYQNNKNGYEISYPDGLEFRLTGSKWKRDGKTFSIEFPKLSLAHGLDGTLYLKKTLAQLVEEAEGVPNLEQLNDGPVEECSEDRKREYCYKWFKVTIYGKEAVKGEYYHEPSGQTLLRSFVLDQVWFHYTEHPIVGAFDAALAEKIISTFRFYK